MMRCALVVGAAGVACGGPQTPAPPAPIGQAQLSLAADARMVLVPAGQYIAGSTPEERAAAYDDYQKTAGHDAAREQRWFDREKERHIAKLDAFRIDLMPVTQAQYAELVATGDVPAPAIDEAQWKAQGFSQDFATEVARFVWRDGRPPNGREDHPVVLVTWDEATKYCAWRGTHRGESRRLPTAAELEKAARGDNGMSYPWGNTFEAEKLNSAVTGPGDTVPAGGFVEGASQYGVLDLAGNVFQWTATADEATPGEKVVKGSAWDDFAGVGRGASGHGRPPQVRHVIVGFRCAAEP